MPRIVDLRDPYRYSRFAEGLQPLIDLVRQRTKKRQADEEAGRGEEEYLQFMRDLEQGSPAAAAPQKSFEQVFEEEHGLRERTPEPPASQRRNPYAHTAAMEARYHKLFGKPMSKELLEAVVRGDLPPAEAFRALQIAAQTVVPPEKEFEATKQMELEGFKGTQAAESAEVAHRRALALKHIEQAGMDRRFQPRQPGQKYLDPADHIRAQAMLAEIKDLQSMLRKGEVVNVERAQIRLNELNRQLEALLSRTGGNEAGYITDEEPLEE